MFKIATLNKISPVGLSVFSEDYLITDEPKTAAGIVVRSHPMKDMQFSDNLLAIARAGAGVNNIPTDRCAEEGIVVFNTPGANANAVKELVIAGMLISARNLSPALEWIKSVKEDVAAGVEKNKSQFAGRELRGKTLGVIGLGAIGVLVANAAEALGMKVLGYDPFISLKSAHELSNSIAVISDLAQMLPQCDYVSLHVPFMDETAGMIEQRKLSQMKSGATLLNFSRDKLVNEKSLFEALDSGKLSAYITDFPNDNLVDRKGVILLPHLGASTKEAEDNCAAMAAEEMMEFIESGNIINSVNFPACSLGPLNPEAISRIVILNKNIPSMLGKITGTLADLNVNIRDLTNKSKGNFACTLMDVDSCINEEELKKALNFEGIIRIRIISCNK